MKKIGYIDVHCHLTNEKEYAAAGGTEAVIAAAKNAGADTLIVSGFDEASSKAAAEYRSEERRVGKEGRPRRSPNH